MTLPSYWEKHSPTTADLVNPEKPESQEQLPSQTVEDWLFAYVNARSHAVQETMLPHLIESIEELVAEFNQMHARQKRNSFNSA